MATATALNLVVHDSAAVAHDADAPEAHDATGEGVGGALDLVAHIVRVHRRGLSIDALTSELLPALLAGFEAAAGALLVYRREEASLALSAARGLSAAGARVLETVRWGDPNGWDMPLRALRDRKAYLTHPREDDDSFLSELAGGDEHASHATVAAIPLHYWQSPVGVLLIVAARRAKLEQAIVTRRLAYDVLAFALAAEPAVRTAAPAGDPPPLECVRWTDPRDAAREETARLLADEREPRGDNSSSSEALSRLRCRNCARRSMR
jgi:hypothetical protein